MDDPYHFGQITAANALSDVYAMGGTPILAMNILACPIKTMAVEIFREIIKGGLSKVVEAGALLVGGHSVEDKELKYGLSVTGTVHPDQVLLNSGARVGDRLILTKPLGTGILSTAIKGQLAGADIEKQITHIMATLNRAPADAITAVRDRGYQVHACTDITGFGLLGHLHEMTIASGVKARLIKKQIPLISGCIDFVNMGIIPEGAYTNRKFYSKWLQNRGTEGEPMEMVLADPQTSGGLLIAAPPTTSEQLLKEMNSSNYPFSCRDIGEIVAGESGVIELI
ncbi:selenophosphate synthase [Desulfocapsa sulfexigens DSM 10523]|uniref:Selenophosphate synthase n=1 Tax=Desulfocapsa sulfexigens (strain DSM 10523 / SB164P1) TaxID=1167006 RepID=M1P813_DESSD|nr:selenophosphate synthase [Desulfocapsa sulfexigens DSM 10523]